MNLAAADSQTPSRHITAKDATRLLRLGLAGPRRPIDPALDLMRDEAGQEWFRTALSRGPVGQEGDPEALLLRGEADLDRLRALKDRCKRLLNAVPDEREKAGIVVAYFLVLAAAIAHHGTSISSRARSEVDPVLIDIADLAPEPWRAMLLSAAVRHGT